MRIAFLTPEFVTEKNFDGGLANYLGHVTHALVQRGHQVEVFVTSETPGRFEHQGVMVHRVVPQGFRGFRLVNAGLRRLRLPTFYQTQDMMAVAYSLDRALRSRAREVRFDVVQAASFRATGLWATHRSVAPVVVRISSYAPFWTQAYNTPRTLDHRFRDWLEIVAIRRCPWRYAPSRFMADTLARSERLQVEVVEPPVQLDHVVLDEQVADTLTDWPGYVLHFGTLGRLKGSGVLAEAVHPLLKTMPGFHLVLAGKVMDEAGRCLINLAQRYPDQVRYLGVLPAVQLYPVVHNARLVVLPSLIDNLPNTCLEAMALGRIVIATRGVSFEQLIEEERSGLLVEPGDVGALRSAIVQAWQMSAEELVQIRAAAKERIARLHPDITIPKLEAFYAAAMAGKRSKALKHVGCLT
jgi:glycosyltransferase involved in cell wall biosynthesis